MTLLQLAQPALLGLEAVRIGETGPGPLPEPQILEGVGSGKALGQPAKLLRGGDLEDLFAHLAREAPEAEGHLRQEDFAKGLDLSLSLPFLFPRSADFPFPRSDVLFQHGRLLA